MTAMLYKVYISNVYNAASEIASNPVTYEDAKIYYAKLIGVDVSELYGSMGMCYSGGCIVPGFYVDIRPYDEANEGAGSGVVIPFPEPNEPDGDALTIPVEWEFDNTEVLVAA